MSQVTFTEDKFKLLLNSITIEQIKEAITTYNEKVTDANSAAKPLKGYTGLKKAELVEFVDKGVPSAAKKDLYAAIMPGFAGQLCTDALALINGENRAEKIKTAGLTPGGVGYNVWFDGKYKDHKAMVQILRTSPGGKAQVGAKVQAGGKGLALGNTTNASGTASPIVNRDCNCTIGKAGGVCLHQMTVYLMLLQRNAVQVTDFPFELDGALVDTIQKRLALLATQSLFKEDPIIVISEDYEIFLNGGFVTLKWGGDFKGKTTKDFSGHEEDIDDFITEKTVDVLLRKIKPVKLTEKEAKARKDAGLAKKMEGRPLKLLIDSFDIVNKILARPKLVETILTKFAGVEDPNLPTTADTLGEFLSRDLRENTEEILIQPPCSAYNGEEPYIFISYVHKDKPLVFPILKRLSDDGVRFWYDEGIPLGQDWCNSIDEKLVGSALVVFFISPNLMESTNTQGEIRKALEKKKAFLTVFLRPTELPADVKEPIMRIQGIMKFEIKDEDKFYEKLSGEIKKIVKK